MFYGGCASYILFLQSLLKTADQLKIKGLCEVPESREGPATVSLSSPPPPRDSAATPRLNYSKLKRHPKYKRPRTSFQEPQDRRQQHYDSYNKEQEVHLEEDFGFENREVCV